MPDEQNQQDPQPTAQEAPPTSGEPTQSSSAPMQLQAPSGFEASGYAPGAAASGSSATFAATAPESGLTNDAPAVAQVGEQVPSLGTIAFGAPAEASTSTASVQALLAQLAPASTAKSSHHIALEELVGAIRKTFNMLGGELEAAVRKAEDIL